MTTENKEAESYSNCFRQSFVEMTTENKEAVHSRSGDISNDKNHILVFVAFSIKRQAVISH